MNDIEGVWAKLEEDAKSRQSSGIQKIRILAQTQFNIFLGYEKPKNRRIFLLIVSPDNVQIIAEYPKSQGFEVQLLSIPDDNGLVYLELILTNGRFSDVFTCLIQDIIEHIQFQENETQIVKMFIGRLLKWQQFLDQYDPEGLSEEAQRGLFGELWVLRKYMIPFLGLSAAIDSWKGPEKKQQDFKFYKSAVEVKTTTSKLHQKIQIASEQQLDSAGLDSLYLYHISLINGIGSGETLPEIVDSIRHLIAPDFEAVKKFEDSLINAGYISTHIGRYSGIKYLIRTHSAYKVDGDFPRIIGQNLLNGVGDVHYSINVSECAHYIIPEEEFNTYLRGV